MDPSDSSFRVTLYLSCFYHDHRSVCRVFVSEGMQTVKDLKARISEIFGIENYYLTSQNHFLPDQEDVRILQRDDVIIAIPNTIPLPVQTEGIGVVNQTICTPKLKENGSKKKKRKITEIEDLESIALEVENSPVKKKKKEKKKLAKSMDSARKSPTEKYLPSTSSKNKSEVAKIPQDTKFTDTINYFETLKNATFPKSTSKIKIQPIDVQPKFKENLTTVLSIHKISSTPNPGSENTGKVNIQPLDVEPAIKARISDHRTTKSHIFYSSTPKRAIQQNQNNSFGPPLMKIERKVNIVKNIITCSGNIVSNNTNAVGNKNDDERNNIDKVLNTNEMEIANNVSLVKEQSVNTNDMEIVNNINLVEEKSVKTNDMEIANNISFVKEKSVNTNDMEIVNNINLVKEKSVNKICAAANNNNDTCTKSFANSNEKYINFTSSGNKQYSSTVPNEKDIPCGTVVAEQVSTPIPSNDQKHKTSADKFIYDNNNQTDSVRKPSEIVSISDSSVMIPHDAVLKNDAQDAISISSNGKHDAPNSVNHDEMEKMSVNSDRVTLRSKRKRVRKRRKRTSGHVESDAPDPVLPFKPIVSEAKPKIQPFKPIVSEAKPKIHIRFNNDTLNGKEADETSVILIQSGNESSVSPTVNIFDGKFEKMEHTGTKNAQSYDVKDKGLGKEVILSRPTMKKLVPEKNDVVTFKLVKLSESYTPECSKYITGRVDGYDPITGNVKFFIFDGGEELYEPVGKFSLKDDEPEDRDRRKNLEEVTLNWHLLMDPRFLYP